jgi:hypothetical protein
MGKEFWDVISVTHRRWGGRLWFGVHGQGVGVRGWQEISLGGGGKDRAVGREASVKAVRVPQPFEPLGKARFEPLARTAIADLLGQRSFARGAATSSFSAEVGDEEERSAGVVNCGTLCLWRWQLEKIKDKVDQALRHVDEGLNVFGLEVSKAPSKFKSLGR